MEIIYPLKMLRYVLQEDKLLNIFNNPLTLTASKIVLSVFGLYTATKVALWLRLVYHTIGRDLGALYKLLKTKFRMSRFRRQNATVAKVFKEVVKRHPDKPLVYSNDQMWTFREMDEFSNRIANFFIEQGYSPGDEAALFMESKPEFIGIWLGLAKAGLVTALINTNQRKESLIHSIISVSSKALIYGPELEDAVLEAYPSLREKRDLKYFCFPKSLKSGLPVDDLEPLIEKSCTEDPAQLYLGNYTDKVLYIYTSGTTGLPKAAVIKNCRFLFVCHGVTNLIGLGDSEVIYTCLPLYHLSGGIIGAGLCLTMGHSIAIRHKFSAKNFWNDCIKYRCTVAQYIGEICRYLLCQPESPADRAHNVRCMFGNGLRLNIWKEFVERFNIERIGEFYGATEGNANVVNVNNKIGACGFVSQMLPGPLTDLFYPVSIIKVDEVTGEPLRKPNGLCIRCGPGDTGEFVGKIYPDDPTRAFDGYANREASDKKIIRNVFKHGDAFFSSGDLLTLDEFGYAFFKDRTGDTFRWKGENVSTTEVEAAIGSYLEHVDCVVYGVEIPGCEGRAGMAAILDPDDKVDVNKLLAEIRNVLPSYSIPTFVRKCQDFTTTATFKLPKVTLRNQAFDPSIVPDPIYYYDIRRGQYVKLDQQAYKQIKDGQIRF